MAPDVFGVLVVVAGDGFADRADHGLGGVLHVQVQALDPEGEFQAGNGPFIANAEKGAYWRARTGSWPSRGRCLCLWPGTSTVDA